MKNLLQESDYHHRKLYAWQSLSSFHSPHFQRAFVFAFLLHLPFFFFYSSQRETEHPLKKVTITLQDVQRTRIQNLDHLDSSAKKDEASKEVQDVQDVSENKSPQETPPQVFEPQENNSFQSTFEKQISSKPSPIPTQKTNTVKTPEPTWEISQGQTDTNENPKDVAPPSANTGGKKKGRVRWQGGHSRKTLYLPQVQYPSYYLSKGIQAKGIFSIEIDAGGTVIGVSTLRSTGYPGLDVEAKNALRAARFSVIEDVNRIDRGEIDVEFKLK